MYKSTSTVQVLVVLLGLGIRVEWFWNRTQPANTRPTVEFTQTNPEIPRP